MWYISHSSAELIFDGGLDNSYGLILKPGSSSERVWSTDTDTIKIRLLYSGVEFQECYSVGLIKSILEGQLILRFGTDWKNVNLDNGPIKYQTPYISSYCICSHYSILYYDGKWAESPPKSNIFLKL